MKVDTGGIRETGNGPIQFTTETSVSLAEVNFSSECSEAIALPLKDILLLIQRSSFICYYSFLQSSILGP
jgi:hypothetical protein